MRSVASLIGFFFVVSQALVSIGVSAQTPTYAIHIPEPSHGNIVSLAGDQVEPDRLVELEITPDEGYGLKPNSLYRFNHTTGGSQAEITETGGRYSFRMPAHDVRIVGEFARLYRLTVSSEVNAEAGTFTFLPSDRVFVGTEVLIQVSAKPGYKLQPGTLEYQHGIEGWKLVQGGRLVMPSRDVQVRAKFLLDEEAKFEVVVDQSYGPGVISVYPKRAKASQEVLVNLSVPPGMRYVDGTLRWCKGTEKSPDASAWTPILDGKFRMPQGTHVFVTADIEVDESAKYSVQIDETVQALSPHALLATPSVKLREGDIVAIKDQAPEGYQFVKGTLEWRLADGAEWTRVQGNTFAMPASDVVVRGTFKKRLSPSHRYKITYAEMEGGVVRAEQGDESLPRERVVLLVHPLKGQYVLVEGSLTYESTEGGVAKSIYRNETSNQYAFTMPEHDVLIRAQFARVYSVSVWSNQDLSRGSIAISPNVAVQAGSRVELHPQAKPGYSYVAGTLEWSADNGATWQRVEDGAIEMPEAPVLVRAEFVADPSPDEEESEPNVYYSVHLRVEGSGTLEVLDGEKRLAQQAQVLKGKHLLIRATPSPGFRLDFVLVNEIPYRDSVLVLEGEAIIMARFLPEQMSSVLSLGSAHCSPNPFGRVLRVSLDGVAVVRLYSMAGVEMRQVHGQDAVEVETAGLPSGVYLLHVDYGDGVVQTLRVMHE